MLKKTFFIIIPLVFLLLAVGGNVIAETASSTDVDKVELENPLPTVDMRMILGNIVATAMGVLGSLVLLVFIYGGFLWLTAAGSAEKVSKGSQTMLWAIVGLFIIFGAYGIISLVFSAIGAKDTGYNPWGVAGYEKPDMEKAQEGCYCKEKDKNGTVSASKIFQPGFEQVDCEKTGEKNLLGKTLFECDWQTFQTTAPTSTK
jgi:amino acid transporter